MKQVQKTMNYSRDLKIGMKKSGIIVIKDEVFWKISKLEQKLFLFVELRNLDQNYHEFLWMKKTHFRER